MNPEKKPNIDGLLAVALACETVTTSVTLAGSDMRDHAADIRAVVADLAARDALIGELREALFDTQTYVEADEITHGRTFGTGDALRAQLATAEAELSTLRGNAHRDQQLIDSIGERADALADAVEEAMSGCRVDRVGQTGRTITDAKRLWLLDEVGAYRKAKRELPPHPDTVRLDWLTKEGARVVLGIAGFFIYWGDADETNGEWQKERFETPRAAIDAARQGGAK